MVYKGYRNTDGVLEGASPRQFPEFFRYFYGQENDRTGGYDYKRKGRSGSGYNDDDSLTKAEQRRANTAYQRVPISRAAADQYKIILGTSFRGNLIMPEAKDTTYKGSSFSKVVTDQKTGYPVLTKEGKTTPMGQAAATLGGGSSSRQARPLRTQRSLFGGNVRDLMPSQRRDLTRRRAARASAAKTKKTLGV